MVELALVPRGVSTVQAPRTAVSPGEVAAPYQELANNLDKIGEAAGNVAEQQAEAAGHNAVRTDDQGNYVVDKAPYILGPASQSYARAARYEYLTKITPQIQDEVTRSRIQYANDPEKLKAHTDEYTKELTKNISDPTLRGPVERTASEAASQAYRTALVSKDATTRQNALTGITSQLAMINEQSTALARQGGTDTPEYQRLARDRAALYQELGGDPRFGYPKERIEQELKANRDDDVVQYKIGQIVREYKTKQNGAEARQAAQEAFWGPRSEELGLSVHKRDAAVTETYRALASMTAEEKAGTQENRAMTSEYIQGLKDAPNTFNDIKHNSMLEQAKKFNDDKLVGELNATRTLIPLMQWAKGANLQEGTAALDAAHKGIIPNWSPLDRVTRSIFQQESSSGANPSTSSTGAMGPMQIMPGTFAMYARPGENIRDPVANKAVGDRIVADLYQKFHGDAARVAVGYFSGEGNVAPPGSPTPWKIDKSDGTTRVSQYVAQVTGRIGKESGGIVPGEPIANQPVAVQRLFQSTVTSLHSQVSKQAQLSADTIVKTLEKGETLEPNELGDFAQAAAETGQEAELLPKVVQAIQASKGADEAEKAGQITALKAQIEEVKASGVNPIARRVLDETVKMIDLNQKRLKEDPLSAGTLAHEVKSINQIDFTNPAAAANELKERDGKMKVMRQLHPEIPQTAPIIGAGEGKVIANALISGPVDQADGFLKAASLSLSPETFKATMASDEMKGALVTMSRSADPARMQVGMNALDKLWQSNAPGFAATYGANTQQRLLAYNAMRGQFPPEEIAARLSKADDPAEAKSREEQGKLVDQELAKEAKTLDPVRRLVGNFFQRQFPQITSAPEFSQGFLDAPQAGKMVAEYTATMKALRMYGVDPDKAAELAQKQLQKDWKQSDVGGGRIMKNRPEDFYPEINGSHDWMTKALEEDLTGAFGPRTTDVATEVGTSQAINWTVKAMVADKRTEAEIAAHRPPSYQVIVTRNGMDELYHDPKTGNRRIAFDPTPHQAAYDKGFVSLDEYRKRVQQLRATGVEGMDVPFLGLNVDKPTSTLPTPAGLPVTPQLGTRG